MKNLVIVESPAKARTLERFLGKDFRVLSSYGHVRDLRAHSFGVNTNGSVAPQYEVPPEKAEVVRTLRKAAGQAETVWLASDEDREGEAIAWHLAVVLGLDVETTRRIVFHEITKEAIVEAVKHPRRIDLNLVNAQQARRVLDRIVGFKISPVLWRRLKPSLSAGRVQSVCLRLIVEREREIESFQQEANWRVAAQLLTRSGVTVTAEYGGRLSRKEEAENFLLACKDRAFHVDGIQKRQLRRVPAPPFTTSTLQQEAARKLGMSVAQTMSVAQRLYESGLITYMRTDSVNLSTLCLTACHKEIVESLGSRYARRRQYQTRSKGAQEAHEAIRPTYMDRHEIEGTSADRRLYDLIWKRTIASQMADAEIEKTVVDLSVAEADGNKAIPGFVAGTEVVTFDGFLRVYRESTGEDEEAKSSRAEAMPWNGQLAEGELLAYSQLTATERFSQHPPRYNEASLVHKLEELGIGRPSTYAPTISTIQQRQYVEKGDRKGVKRSYGVLTLTAGKGLKSQTKSETVGNEKGKLLPTDIGTVVNDFLVQHFPSIVDYNFTANVEKDFDEIAEGKEDWQQMIADFYNDLSPLCDQVLKEKEEHKIGERLLGTDPVSGKPVSVKIGRFGPVAQIGTSENGEKPRFSRLNKGQSIQNITLEEALELFKLPRVLGEHDGKTIRVGSGRFGPYVVQDKLFASIPKDIDALAITLEEAVQLLEEKRQGEARKHLRTFDEEPELEILQGRFGPYLSYKGMNYKLPKSAGDPLNLTATQCLDIIRNSAKIKKSKK